MEKTNSIQVNVTGIKCDNPECDYADMSVLPEDYPNWIDRPCPKCGANLLTKQDYNSLKTILDLVNLIKESSVDLINNESDKLAKLTINMNGTGEIKIEHEEITEENI